MFTENSVFIWKKDDYSLYLHYVTTDHAWYVVQKTGETGFTKFSSLTDAILHIKRECKLI